jgi:HEAT repeat protein
MKTFIPTLIAMACILALAYLWLTGPDREVQRTTRINEHMNFLKDQLKANPSNREPLQAMLQAVHSSDSFERTAAIGYLGEAGSAAKPAVPVIIEALNGDDGFSARAAAISLGQIGPAAKDAIPDLIRAVEQHPNEDIGWFSAESLGHVADSNDAIVVKLLTQATNSPDQDIRYSANKGLQALQGSH